MPNHQIVSLKLYREIKWIRSSTEPDVVESFGEYWPEESRIGPTMQMSSGEAVAYSP